MPENVLMSCKRYISDAANPYLSVSLCLSQSGPDEDPAFQGCQLQ